jgi:hypothetical protein
MNIRGKGTFGPGKSRGRASAETANANRSRRAGKGRGQHREVDGLANANGRHADAERRLAEGGEHRWVAPAPGSQQTIGRSNNKQIM